MSALFLWNKSTMNWKSGAGLASLGLTVSCLVPDLLGVSRPWLTPPLCYLPVTSYMRVEMTLSFPL